MPVILPFSSPKLASSSSCSYQYHPIMKHGFWEAKPSSEKGILRIPVNKATSHSACVSNELLFYLPQSFNLYCHSLTEKNPFKPFLTSWVRKCHASAPAGNKEPHSCSPAPSPRWDGEERNAKLMGWDKDSLTEQQREKKITTVILIKRI